MQPASSANRLDRAFANFSRRHLHRDLRIAYLGDGTSTQTVVNPTTATYRAVWYYEQHSGQKMPKATATLDENCGVFYENSADNDNLEVWIGKKPFSTKTYVLGPTENALSAWAGQTPLERRLAGPKRATLWHRESTVLTGNGFLRTVDANQPDNHYAYQTPSANADSFTNSFWLRPGTYTFTVLGLWTANSAKIDWYIDGVSVVTGQDWYNAATTYNLAFGNTVTVTAKTGAYHVLKGVVNGRNAGSGGWDIKLTSMWFKPSVD